MKTRVAALVLTFLLFGAFLPAAGANTISKTDGNDSPGPLDLASMRVSHSGTTHLFRMTTQAAFTNAQIDGDIGWFRVGFDLNADQTYDRNIFVFYAAGRMRAVLTDRSLTALDYDLWATRVSGTTVEVKLPMSKIGSPKNYDFAVWTVSKSAPCTAKDPCIDFIPNRYPLIRHDLTAPVATWGTVPTYSTDASATLTFPVSFSTKDIGFGSGVKSWTLSMRLAGTKTWDPVKTGTSSPATVRVSGEEGLTYEFRVDVADRQGNRSSIQKRFTTVPFDDANVALIYDTSWSASAGITGAFLDTLAISTTAGATVTMPVQNGYGVQVCVVGGPSAAPVSADMTLDENTRLGFLSETSTTPKHSIIGCRKTPAGSPGPHALSVTVPAGTGFVIDGIVVVG